MKRKRSLHLFPFMLRKYREAAGMSQADLAKRADFLPSAISHFERGRREPSLTNAVRLAMALGRTMDEMVSMAVLAGGKA